MDPNWVTVAVLLFGIIVAVYGVYEYLRMFKHKNDESGPKTPPSAEHSASSDDEAAPASPSDKNK
ncbi:hypothetical protein [Paenibacillus protaetiae]|uniref:Uncharacterized protein n=1 Tax=Paenibacillus protaetiae TaxID=2509456 RepID=A0A4P6EVR6_9BACL|nr:hypothetical protein [Paenibacillus protaetiae]QAY67132.1 hypothetical protein ET464_12725 [Paenibacillus protaetiae]